MKLSTLTWLYVCFVLVFVIVVVMAIEFVIAPTAAEIAGCMAAEHDFWACMAGGTP